MAPSAAMMLGKMRLPWLFVSLVVLGVVESSSDSRLWRVDLRASRVGVRIDPSWRKKRRVVTYARIRRDGSFTAADGALAGSWTVRAHPYELLERIPDDVILETRHRGLSMVFNGRIWDRHLPPSIPRRVTHGVVSVQTTPKSPRLIVATFKGREASQEEEAREEARTAHLASRRSRGRHRSKRRRRRPTLSEDDDLIIFPADVQESDEGAD